MTWRFLEGAYWTRAVRTHILETFIEAFWGPVQFLDPSVDLSNYCD